MENILILVVGLVMSVLQYQVKSLILYIYTYLMFVCIYNFIFMCDRPFLLINVS